MTSTSALQEHCVRLVPVASKGSRCRHRVAHNRNCTLLYIVYNKAIRYKVADVKPVCSVWHSYNSIPPWGRQITEVVAHAFLAVCLLAFTGGRGGHPCFSCGVWRPVLQPGRAPAVWWGATHTYPLMHDCARLTHKHTRHAQARDARTKAHVARLKARGAHTSTGRTQ